MDEFEAAANAAREGRITLDDWARAWGPKWERWAALFERRYRLPHWYTRADVAQDLALAAWQFWERFDASRGVSFAKYLEWNAVKRTVKSVSKARGVEQHRRRGPARPEAPMSSLPEDVAAKCDVAVEAGQEERVLRAQCYAELRERAGVRGGIVDALCVEGGEVDAASAKVYADPRLRLQFRLSSRTEAKTLVRDTIRALAQEATS